MKATRSFLFISLAALLIAPSAVQLQAQSGKASPPTSPPVAPVRAVTEDFYGMKVVDPYRYMEDDKLPEVAQWFKEQNAYTRAVLARIPGRDALLADIKKYDQSAPARVSSVTELPGGLYFYEKVLAQQNIPKLYMRRGLDGQEVLLLDPAKFEEKGGPQWAISYYSPSFDGRYVAVGVAPGGSEHAVLHVVDTSTGSETGEALDRAWWGIVGWRRDNHSFFYNRVQKLGPNEPSTETEEKSKIYLHTVGTDASQDKIVFGYGVLPGVPVSVTDIPVVATDPESSYALGILEHGVQNEVTVYATPVNEDSGRAPVYRWRKVIDTSDDVTGAAVHGDDLYLITHQDAPRFKVVEMNLSDPDFARARHVLPQSQAVVQNIAAAKDALYVQELDGGVGRLVRVPYDGGAAEQVKLPVEGAFSLSSTDTRMPGAVFSLTAWTKATAIYAYDPGTQAVKDTHLQPAGPFDAPADLQSVEMKAPSYDGTLVPLSIIYKRGLKLDGSNPTILDGYGAYGITIDPYYDPKLLAWYERGGVFAVAHVRGGGEYGDAWHKAGMMLTKPNTWRDFIACAEYLVAHKYTSSERLAIEGGSAGGITVGRFITERPDLAAAAIDAVGVSNPLRSEFSPNGPPNIPEFGSVKTQFGFEDLYAMDSYQHVQNGVRYPAVLLTTGWNDPRVSSWEPGKMTARLQAATASGKPVLLRVDYSGGHGFGSTKEQHETELADEWSFLLWQLGMPGFQPPQ